MKRFKQMAAMLLFALLTAGFTSSAMASSGSGGDPWDFGIPGHYFFCKLQPPDSLQLEPPLGEFCWH